ncbi:Roadblock/LC7 family protein [Deinococcus proteolyticus MRP]|uniref:Roadblock/LC7 family protein n=1 Tax=Deinococcus proteolyticus (strain ATCC 35074 / DSM 20540 / JCM 6276 / NBRC 101906 / NCIMB 13154 / VKM Ac-1939 / CCM 2703 / MRP) TaxID=693977 RepID=F0RM57_DEIPM|nr:MULTISPECIES: roadblock/LC7 domain-containing protein [Deinococcus]ADY25977.1 Roadblock/LC7 family protein [Deinococcus proteolyticus MRP]MCY1702098.1 roadblock/LC7 domain-containing protein [Deinococcus sp. SL84]
MSAALNTLLEGRGVRSAVLYGAQGEVLGSAGGEDATAGLLTPARAIVQTLEQTLGAQGWNDLLLDLDTGPVLLTPGQDGQVLAVAFDDLSSLGRVRLSVRRALESLAG